MSLAHGAHKSIPSIPGALQSRQRHGSSRRRKGFRSMRSSRINAFGNFPGRSGALFMHSGFNKNIGDICHPMYGARRTRSFRRRAVPRASVAPSFGLLPARQRTSSLNEKYPVLPLSFAWVGSPRFGCPKHVRFGGLLDIAADRHTSYESRGDPGDIPPSAREALAAARHNHGQREHGIRNIRANCITKP